MTTKDTFAFSWLGLIWFIIFVLSLSVFPKLLFDDLPLRTTPTADPPWYFIATDFRQFLGASVGFILSLIVVVVSYRKYPVPALTGLFFTFLWYGKFLTDGFRILTHTDHLFSPEIATSTWMTQQEYLNVPWSHMHHVLYILAIGALYMWLRKRQKKISAYAAVA